MKILIKYFRVIFCLLSFCLLSNINVYAQKSAIDSNISKPIASIFKDKKLIDGQKRIAAAFKPVDTSRIIKRKPTFNKNASKSAQDPEALSFGNFKVSKQLYGEYADYIMDYVKNYLNNHGDRMGRIKANNKGYFTMIDNTMRKNSIPKEMHSLAVIESALNPNATSPVGAVGPWQFMPATAQMLGLQVSELADDRRDFYKSTQAAAKFTKRLHNMFHDWLLVVAAYNCGPAPVLRHLGRTGSNSFWDIKQFLPKETQNHVMAFIATSVYFDRNSKVLDLGYLPKDSKNIKLKNAKKEPIKNKKTDTKINTKKIIETEKIKENNIEPNEDDLAIDNETENTVQILPEEMSQVITLKIKGSYNIESIAEVLDYDLNKLRRWNPKFNEQTAILGNQVKLTLPTSKLDAFLIQKDKILSNSIKNPIKTSGNTIYIKGKNVIKDTIHNATKLGLKKEIKSKTASTIIDTTSKVIVSSPKEKIIKNNNIYVVKKGDNIDDIADQLGMSVNKLMKINNLKSTDLKVGSTLIAK